MSESNLDQYLEIFRAIGEETRLRMMVLISKGELTVTEITQVLAQSQPRVSRHLKILSDAGLVERYREGSWVFYRIAETSFYLTAIKDAIKSLEGSGDRVIARDQERFQQVHAARAEVAAQYFQDNAAKWDDLRRLHLPESDIEQAMRDMLGTQPIDQFVDLGTGTGRMLIVFADLYKQAVGYDLSREMLAVARAKLDEENVNHAQIRQGDLFSLPMSRHSADVVCLHQVLHFLPNPAFAVHEAAQLLKPGGRMLIVDFASHGLEFLREEHAHRRLGFTDDEVKAWCVHDGLGLVRVQTLSPGRGEMNKLVVKLWLCAMPQKQNPIKIDTNMTEKHDIDYA